MNAQTILPHTAPDTAALALRWTIQRDTGADTFTVAELDALAAITPANDARAQWEIADARAIEVELLGYDPTAPAPLDNDVNDDCPCCRGTGLGQYDGAVCRECGGTGELLECALFDEPYDLDDDDFDAYMVGAYTAAVA